jgi:hypothetical protein
MNERRQFLWEVGSSRDRKAEFQKLSRVSSLSTRPDLSMIRLLRCVVRQVSHKRFRFGRDG